MVEKIHETPKRSGGDKRGNSHARRQRKEWMISPQGNFGGNGREVQCVHCHQPLTYDKVEADRKIPGGSYRRDNVQPSCRSCNNARSNNTSWTPPKVSQ
jgi:5-methylcytosine-specific restriction endonuclease McrA